jgi:hypothetical protein
MTKDKVENKMSEAKELKKGLYRVLIRYDEHAESPFRLNDDVLLVRRNRDAYTDAPAWYKSIVSQLRGTDIDEFEFVGLPVHETWFVFPLRLDSYRKSRLVTSYELAHNDAPVDGYVLVTKDMWHEWSAEMRYAKAEGLAEAVLDEYNLYEAGEVYCFYAEKLAAELPTREKLWQFVDDTYSATYYGLESAEEAAEELLNELCKWDCMSCEADPRLCAVTI